MNFINCHQIIKFKHSLIKLLCFLSAVIFSHTIQAQEEIKLWPNGAPGFESKKNEPVEAKDWWIKNIHNPSITIFKPAKESDQGIGVLVIPGGGHRALVYNSVGRDAALFLNKLGITAFVLKYRLAREENSPYTIEKHPKEDAQRAMKFIRSKAKEWNINPKKLGMMGFSAGGEVVSMVTFNQDSPTSKSSNVIDKQDEKPNFIIMVYPGPLGIPKEVSEDAPQAFLITANDDECCSKTVVDLLVSYRKVQAPVEAHLYARGGHAFNMGQKENLPPSLQEWSQRLEDWLKENILN